MLLTCWTFSMSLTEAFMLLNLSYLLEFNSKTSQLLQLTLVPHLCTEEKRERTKVRSISYPSCDITIEGL